MKVAIIAYVDNFEKEKFADECNLMTYSGQCLNNNFTFVVFAHPEAVPLIDKYKNVKIVEYIIEDKYYSSYRFAKSLNFVHANSQHLEEYDFIVKTDTDVFFSPKMNDFIFDKNKIYVGLGHYTANEKSIEQLADVANRFGYPTYKRVADMHSTIISETKTMIKIMYLSDLLCREIYYGIDSPGEWGSEHLWRGYYGSNSGICSMYAAEIILSSDKYRDMVIVTTQIDGGSDWDTDYNEIYHYHCYHHDNIYSKHQAKFGSYINIKQQSGNSSAAYCINKYIERRDLGKSNPSLFAKPNFTVFKLPDDHNGPRIWYSFNKKVNE